MEYLKWVTPGNVVELAGLVAVGMAVVKSVVDVLKAAWTL